MRVEVLVPGISLERPVEVDRLVVHLTVILFDGRGMLLC